ncbi:alpha-mannosidase [Paenibacillus sp. IB182496]|uniref:Alpha-mannosidase n=1 Tax=Paenibacillus sabuli TaxID=2772509 RepID=A0A927BP26_9BACL|nr:alpha-mannosidase [Paenibacillus sabuli]MBD2844108.1 alpha-mannosidase [Paenibacillus sabuli]
MRWTEEKLEARIRELEPYRYREAMAIGPFAAQEDPDGAIGARPPARESGQWQAMELGDDWSGRDQYIWLAADVTVPAEWAERRIVGRFDFGTTGGGTNSGFESLLYVDGEPYQGVDGNHREVFLAPRTAGRLVELRFRLWSGLGGYDIGARPEHRLRHASLAWLDEAVDDLYYTARAGIETVRVLQPHAPERGDVLQALDRALRLLDWAEPGSPDFYASAAAAGASLRAALAALPDKRAAVTVTCVGHTHIDVAWLWRLRHTREKAARSFATVLRLMEQYPDYLFLQTQPQLYAYLKQDYPQLYEQIKARIAEGRWEAGGAMWLEADCNLPSGESLVRQLLYGQRFLQEEFGVRCDYLWLPDVFGYSWALPQILRKSGIRVFMTTKISWNQYNRMPHDTFMWKGIDGSEILTHFITTPDPGGQEGSFYYTYNGVVTPETVQGIWEAYRDQDINRNLLLAYGYGDGGGGVNREMLELRRRLADMPGLPQVVTGRADDYFVGLQERVAQTDGYVHTWDGELYLELHRGTYTSQAHIKRANRKAELLLRQAEWLQTLDATERRDWAGYPAERLREAWTIVLRNQFHDIIPGSSIREVYDDCRLEYAEAEEIGQAALQAAQARIAPADADDADGGGAGRPERSGSAERDGSGRWTVFNSASWPRGALVRIGGAASAAAPTDGAGWQDAGGRPLQAQRVGTDWLVRLPDVPALGYAVIGREAGAPPADRPRGGAEPQREAFVWEPERRTLTTPYYVAVLDAAGRLARLYDRGAAREVLAEGARGNELQVFEDKPKSRHEAWDIDIYYTEKMSAVTELLELELEACGELRAVLRLVWRYRGSRIVQRLTAYAHSRRLDFVTEVDWQERRQLLKTAFPVAVRATEATYNVQFGNVRRPTHWNTSWDYARFESVGHQWADLSERGYGVALLNDCKYGYDIKDNVLRLSLIKSANVPDPEADKGAHVFTYALLPHRGDWYEGEVEREAWDLNDPLTVQAGAARQSRYSLLTVDCPHAAIDAVKRAEDEEALLVRLHEFGGASGTVVLNSDAALAAWAECDLMERPIGAWQSGPIRLKVAPYEIKTLLVRLD